MNIDDLVSKATRATGRTIIAVGSAIIIASFFCVKLVELPILSTSKSLSEKMVDVSALFLLMYLVATHVLNWFNDRIGFITGELLDIRNTQIKAEKARQGVRLMQNIERPSYDQLVEQYSLRIGIASGLQHISLYGQHLILPILIGSWSIFILVSRLLA